MLPVGCALVVAVRIDVPEVLEKPVDFVGACRSRLKCIECTDLAVGDLLDVAAEGADALVRLPARRQYQGGKWTKTWRNDAPMQPGSYGRAGPWRRARAAQ